MNKKSIIISVLVVLVAIGVGFYIANSAATPATVTPTTITPSANKITNPAPTKPTSPPVASGPLVKDGCYVGGCSNQICSDSSGAISTCVYNDSFVCYKTATCERQSNGHCGWTQTPELNSCLSASNQPK